MYYQGRVRPVYFQGKRVENVCYACANNHYHAYGDEQLCVNCKEHEHFKGKTKLIEFKIALFNWLNKKGIYAQPKKNWPFIEIDWKRMGRKS